MYIFFGSCCYGDFSFYYKNSHAEIIKRFGLKINPQETTKKHFDSVVSLTSRLAEHNLTIFNHSFNYLCFGSWEIIVGSGHKERKFSWDGRDFLLEVSDRIKTNMTQGGEWKVVYQKPLGNIKDEELFETVFQLAVELKHN